jgi:hypothetical protein
VSRSGCWLSHYELLKAGDSHFASITPCSGCEVPSHRLTLGHFPLSTAHYLPFRHVVIAIAGPPQVREGAFWRNLLGNAIIIGLI